MNGPHRHVSADTRRKRIRHVAGDCYLVLAACRCGATRRELVRYARGSGMCGRLVGSETPWEVSS